MVLVYIEIHQGEIKKSGLEAICFAAQIAKLKSSPLTALVLSNSDSLAGLGNYGVQNVLVANQNIDGSDSQNLCALISQVAEKNHANYIVLSNSSIGKSVAGRLAVRLNRPLVSGVNTIIEEGGKLIFRKSVYSGKASAYYTSKNDKAIIALSPNSISPSKSSDSNATVSTVEIAVQPSKIKLLDRNLVKGKIPLAEADTVVSAGRGMKEPGNWGMIEELADLIGASTACSRPVADIGWRPHHEHVGQTGIAIKPNLYIAIGISGAIQHLAGVNSSRKIIVINKDPEAPFFKAADYGICGDLFEVVPKLNDAIRKFKSSNS